MKTQIKLWSIKKFNSWNHWFDNYILVNLPDRMGPHVVAYCLYFSADASALLLTLSAVARTIWLIKLYRTYQLRGKNSSHFKIVMTEILGFILSTFATYRGIIKLACQIERLFFNVQERGKLICFQPISIVSCCACAFVFVISCRACACFG